MFQWKHLAWLGGGLALFSAGCAQPWPDHLPAHAYTGTVFDGPLHAPAAGAQVHAFRPTFERPGLVFGFAPDRYEIGHATADAKGHFTLRTNTGYATTLNARTADGHLIGGQAVKKEESDGVQIVADSPAFGPILYEPTVNPDLPAFKVTGTAVQQIISYVAAHPQEPMHSLEDYARRGTISREALAAFTGNTGFFFGSSPGVRYGWGKDVLVFPDARKPIALRRGKLGHDPVF